MNGICATSMGSASIFSCLTDDNLNTIYNRLDKNSRAKVRATCIDGRQLVHDAATQVTYVSHGPYWNDDILQRASFLGRLPNLRSIRVETKEFLAVGFTDDHLNELLHVAALVTSPLGRGSVVENLDICCGINDLHFVSSFTGLRSLLCTQACSLRTCAPLSACPSLTDICLEDLPEPAHQSIGSVTQLRYLFLRPAFPSSFPAVRLLSNLETLRVFSSGLSVFGIVTVAPAFCLARLTTLQISDLRHPGVGDILADVALAFAQLADMRHLRCLRLGSHFHVDTIALAAIGSLQGLTCLEVGNFTVRHSGRPGGILPSLRLLKLSTLQRPSDMLRALGHFAPLNELRILADRDAETGYETSNLTFKTWHADRESLELAALEALATMILEAPHLAVSAVYTYGRMHCSKQVSTGLASLFARYDGLELEHYEGSEDDPSYQF